MSVRRVLEVSVLSVAAALGCWSSACSGDHAGIPSLGGQLDAGDEGISAAADGAQGAAPPAEAGLGDSTVSMDGADGDGEADATALLDAPRDADAAPDSGDASLDAMIDADAGSDSGDGGLPDTQTIIKTLLGASCLACAVKDETCLGQVQNCESFSPSDQASAGPAEGTTLTQLCRETLTCVLASKCVEQPADQPDLGEINACYCGDVDYSTCDTDPGQGSCRLDEERGLETTNPDDVLANIPDPTYGAGMANTIADCLLDFCQTDCFP
jgi:hypothetical protein